MANINFKEAQSVLRLAFVTVRNATKTYIATDNEKLYILSSNPQHYTVGACPYARTKRCVFISRCLFSDCAFGGLDGIKNIWIKHDFSCFLVHSDHVD